LGEWDRKPILRKKNNEYECEVESMRISMLKLKNCLGIKELEFKPGKIILIEGSEGKGKTSILESIQRFFWNKSERSSFVYKDEEGTAEKAETYIDLDDGTMMKKFINSENKVTTTGIDKGGMSPKKPEEFLKSLVSEEQLNPVKIINMPDKEFTELVLSLIPIKVTSEDAKQWLLEVPPFVDFNKHGLQVCKDIVDVYFNKRTEVNRRIKDLTAEIKADKAKLPEDYDPEAWRNVSITEKYDAIKAANKVNGDRQIQQAKVDSKDGVLESLRNQAKADIADVKQKSTDSKKTTEDKIAELKKQITVLESELAQADAVCAEKVKTTTDHYKGLADAVEKETEDSKKYLESNPEIDIVPLETAHKEADNMKSFIRSADDLKVKETELIAKETEAQKLTDKIEFMRTKPQMLLAKAEMPLEGITVDSQGNVLVNNRPPINLSGGERIRFAVKASKSTAGPLKIILINGFEALSPKAQIEFIEECEKDPEFQYWITKVTDGDLRVISVNEFGTAVDAETGEEVTL
jgi:energy-coupling factor transporter ATP-binding protein EcfA2